MTRYICVILSLLIITVPFIARSNALEHKAEEKKKELILELMNMSIKKLDFLRGLDQMVAVTMNDLRKKMPDEDVDKLIEPMLDELKREFLLAYDSGVFHVIIYPIYDKYYNQEDLESVIEFYHTPAGKKILKHSSDVALEVTIKIAKFMEYSLKPIIDKHVDRIVQEHLQNKGM